MEETKRSGGPRGGHVSLFFTRCFGSLSIDSGNGGGGGKRGEMGHGNFTEEGGGGGDDSVSFDDLHSPVENRRWFHRMHYAWPKFCLLVSLVSCQSPGSRGIFCCRDFVQSWLIVGRRCGNVVHVFLFDVFLPRWFRELWDSL